MLVHGAAVWEPPELLRERGKAREGSNPVAVACGRGKFGGFEMAQSKDTIQRLIRLKRTDDDKLRKLAFDNRVSVAAVVRQIIEDRLKK